MIEQSFIHRSNGQCFDWLTWRAGSILEVFNIKHRYDNILLNRNKIRKHAIGYCLADNIPCRPKEGYIAVMFEIDFRQWWTHFTIKEFNITFPEHVLKEDN